MIILKEKERKGEEERRKRRLKGVGKWWIARGERTDGRDNE